MMALILHWLFSSSVPRIASRGCGAGATIIGDDDHFVVYLGKKHVDDCVILFASPQGERCRVILSEPSTVAWRKSVTDIEIDFLDGPTPVTIDVACGAKP